MARMLLAVLAVWAVIVGCVSETTRTTPPPMRAVPVHVKERFRVFAGDDLLGYMLLNEIAGERYFRVETPNGAWVGDIQKYGRFFRCEPFRDAPRDLGLHPMHEGLALLFDARAPIRVLPLEGRGEPTEAAAHGLLEKALDDK